MFLRILKKDLKRKKTMNVILLLFVILATMFAASSMNNMITIYGGIDYFFDKAGMADYVFIVENSNGDAAQKAEDVLTDSESVTGFNRENIVFINSNNLKDEDGNKYCEFEGIGIITGVSDAKLNYYNRNDEIITEIPEGHCYAGGEFRTSSDVHVGDTITLELKGTTIELTLDGYIKDALLGTPLMGNPRLLMSDSDVSKLLANEDIRNKHDGAVFYVSTDDVKALQRDTIGLSGLVFGFDVNTLRLTYLIEMLTAGLMMVVSICLILISFTMLSFTIKFTMTEDFREIGVMKAVGIKNKPIRGLYLIKYLCISVVGAVIGYILAIPFGELLLKNASESMLLGNEDQGLIGVLSAVAVVLVILGFCYFCTRRIKKMSPIDAVRNGETGERYNRRSILRLTKSKLGSNAFMAANDVASKPGQYVSMTVTFVACLILITMLANAANTLMSDKLLYLIGTTESDVYYDSTDLIMDAMGSDDEDAFENIMTDIEKTLADNGMPGKVHVELQFSLPVEFGDERMTVLMQQCKATHASDYVYYEGTAPEYPNEVAFTPQILDSLGAEIGDTVIIEIGGEKNEYIITASFVAMNQLGRLGRLHEDVPTIDNEAGSAFAFQIDFDDDPSDKVIAERIEKLKEIFGSDKVYTGAEYVDVCTNSASALSSVKDLVLVIALVISALITILMERSFISKETTEIALMKAIGFKTRSICAQHTLRFAIVLLISSVIAALLCIPVTKLVCDRIFAVMGAVAGIDYDIRPVEVFVVYPLIMAAVVIPAAFLTSLYMRTINSESMGNIE